MRVSRFRVHNVLKVSDVDFNLDGQHLFLVGGKNGQGKSSALKALLMALCGRSGCDWPAVALKEGEDEGWVKVDLEGGEADGLTVELYLKRKRGGQVVEEFKLLDAAGKPVAKPRELLQRLYHLRAFDPRAFERLSKAEKRETLMKLVGLDFNESKAEYDKLFRERTDVNRDGKKLRARYDAMRKHPGVPAEEVSVKALMDELDNRSRTNTANRSQRAAVASLADTLKERQAKEAAIRKQISDLMAELDTISRVTAKLMKEKIEAEDRVEKLVDADEDSIRQQIATAEDTNRLVRENRERQKVEKELDEMRAKSEGLSKKLDAITEQQQETLRAAKWPVPGLSVDDEGVLLDGLPIEQAARSIQTLTSVKIGMALNPDLRLLVCEDGSDLDEDRLEALQKVLEEGDFQMLIELVTRGKDDEDRCAVILENGKAR